VFLLLNVTASRELSSLCSRPPRLSESDGGQAQLEYWNDGPPWRDKNVTGLLHCIVSVTEALVLKSAKSGLGQGIMGAIVTCYSNNQ